MKSMVMVLLTMLLMVVSGAHAGTILIDFGADTLTTTGAGDTWNNVSSGRLEASPDTNLNSLGGSGDLLYADGTDSGYTFSAEALGNTKIGGSAVDFTGTLPVNPTGTLYPSSAYADSMFTGNTSESTYTVTLANLNIDFVYDLTFLSAFNGGNDNGDAVWTITQGFGDVLSITNDIATSNDAGFVQLTGISPTQDGVIEILLTSTPEGKNGRWNTLEITEVPEPATIALLGLGAVFFRRRKNA